MKDFEERDVGVFLISAYAPDSGKSEEVWTEYIDQLEDCISRKHEKDVLIIGTDCNASMGVSNAEDSVTGKFGISHVNDAGRRMKNFLTTSDLQAVSTYFKKHNYGT